MSGPDGRRRQPLSRGASDHGHGQRSRYQPGVLLEVEDAACGESTPSNKVLLLKCVRGCVREAVGPEAVVGCGRKSLRQESWKIRQVLVDNMSVAEIGNRCLALGVRAASSRTLLGTRRASGRRRPTTVTGG
jgi:hypothetical protein